MENPDSAATPGRVAFLGLGIMGWPMAANLARAGYELAVWTRTGEKAERFAAEHGARPGATPAEAAKGADAVISMVVDAPEVEAVLLGEHGAHGMAEDDRLWRKRAQGCGELGAILGEADADKHHALFARCEIAPGRAACDTR